MCVCVCGLDFCFDGILFVGCFALVIAKVLILRLSSTHNDFCHYSMFSGLFHKLALFCNISAATNQPGLDIGLSELPTKRFPLSLGSRVFVE